MDTSSAETPEDKGSPLWQPTIFNFFRPVQKGESSPPNPPPKNPDEEDPKENSKTQTATKKKTNRKKNKNVTTPKTPSSAKKAKITAPVAPAVAPRDVLSPVVTVDQNPDDVSTTSSSSPASSSYSSSSAIPKFVSSCVNEESTTLDEDDPRLKAKAVVLVQKLVEYEVEKIVDYSWCKTSNHGLYFVKWLGWDLKENTWEPAINLECPDKLKEFYLERMAAREKATPAQKRFLEVPPDPRTHFERRTNFVDQIFNPPCLTDLEKFFVETLRNPIKAWPEATLSKKLDELSNRKRKVNEQKLGKVKEQLMLKHMREARKQQLARLKEWEGEINQHESPKITVQNDADLEGPARHMSYITKYMPSEGIVIPDDPPIGCECAGGACELRTQDSCCPSNNATWFPYDRWGRLRVDVGMPIYECNKKCKCGEECKNRVVQKGRKAKLCIFRTDNGCGWGVKTLENIKEGSFVVEYVGEVIGNEEAERRGKKYDAEGRTYLFDLDFNLGNDNLYTVDAAFFGNVAHFINHSCDPNLSIFNVWIDCLDPDLPRLCLFARRDIAKGEQITFDYCQQTTQNYVFEDVAKSDDNNPHQLPTNPEGASTSSSASEPEGNSRSSAVESSEQDEKDGEEEISKTECRCGAKNCRKKLFD